MAYWVQNTSFHHHLTWNQLLNVMKRWQNLSETSCLSENFAYTPLVFDGKSAAEVVVMPKNQNLNVHPEMMQSVTVEEALPGTKVKSKLLRKLLWILYLMNKSMICSGNSHSS